jgi:hypothetical protein
MDAQHKGKNMKSLTFNFIKFSLMASGILFFYQSLEEFSFKILISYIYIKVWTLLQIFINWVKNKFDCKLHLTL